MLAAEFVDGFGSVVGIDRSPEDFAFVRESTQSAGPRLVDFDAVSVADFSDPKPFDAVIGRCG